MKIIENNWNQSKEVVYKGSTLIVPIWTNWVATDQSGKVLGFEEEPCENEGTLWSWWEPKEYTDLIVIAKAKFEDNEDWKQSLEYVGE